MTDTRRREFLLATGAVASSLAGCSTGRPTQAPDATLYVGAYHWGFVLLDESGSERDRLTLDPGAVLDLVAVNTSAPTAMDRLPDAVRSAIPDHETLEERNEARIPPPPNADLHDALDAANERYPNHSLAVVPAGQHMGGTMLHPVPLPADATHPTIARIDGVSRGDYTLSCLTYCGYGHPYMQRAGALVVG